MEDPNQIAQELEQAKKKAQSALKSQKVNTCDNCGMPGGLYLCQYHGNVFCKPCLMGTHKEGNNTYYLVKCNQKGDKYHIDCVYNPLCPPSH